MKASDLFVVLAESSEDERRTQVLFDRAKARLKLWIRDNPGQLLPLEGVKLLAACERRDARIRRDRRDDRRLALAERALVAGVGQVSDADVDAEVEKLLGSALSRMSAAELRALATAKIAEGSGDEPS